jgi:hypothetical protein
MGQGAPANPPAPPEGMYVSYSGNASGAPASSDFDASAQCGINWLAEMWDDNTQTLGRVEFVHQDNLLLGQDWRQSFGCSLSVCVLQDQSPNACSVPCTTFWTVSPM